MYHLELSPESYKLIRLSSIIFYLFNYGSLKKIIMYKIITPQEKSYELCINQTETVIYAPKNVELHKTH